MTQFINLAALTAASVRTDVNGGGGIYQITQAQGQNAPSYFDVDHVYEPNPRISSHSGSANVVYPYDKIFTTPMRVSVLPLYASHTQQRGTQK